MARAKPLLKYIELSADEAVLGTNPYSKRSAQLNESKNEPITCVDMHTCGEPTRIVIRGYPALTGTLLEQRAQARAQYDHIRRRLMLEPRGHYDMYGAILRQDTELTRAGQADIGVLFTTNEGYSTMCGHATIALGRFLVDTHDLEVFPNRPALRHDPLTSITTLRLHAPCGLVVVSVPTTENGQITDPTRRVSFESVDCFASCINMELTLPQHRLWPAGLTIQADFAYGGAFYCLVSADQLPFMKYGLRQFDMNTADEFAKVLKEYISSKAELAYLVRHPHEPNLSFLYSVILVGKDLGEALPETRGAETGLCFFADQQVDRSPTGSGVSARLAAAYAHGKLKRDDSWTYHSLASLHLNKEAAFRGTIIGAEDNPAPNLRHPFVRTRIDGHASYTGCHTFIIEAGDMLKDGFAMHTLAGKR